MLLSTYLTINNVYAFLLLFFFYFTHGTKNMISGINVVKRIDFLLEENGISRKDMCDELEIPVSTLSNWKARNIVPGAEYILQICQYFEVSMKWILSEDSQSLFYPKRSITLENCIKVLSARLGLSDYSTDKAIQHFWDAIQSIYKDSIINLAKICSKRKFVNWLMGRIEFLPSEYLLLAKMLRTDLETLLQDSKFIEASNESSNAPKFYLTDNKQLLVGETCKGYEVDYGTNYDSERDTVKVPMKFKYKLEGLKFVFNYSDEKGIHILLDDNDGILSSSGGDTYFIDIDYYDIFFDKYLYTENTIDSVVESFCENLAEELKKALPEDYYNESTLVEGYWECLGLSKEVCRKPLAQLWKQDRNKQISDCKAVIEKIQNGKRNFSDEELRTLQSAVHTELSELQYEMNNFSN